MGIQEKTLNNINKHLITFMKGKECFEKQKNASHTNERQSYRMYH